MTADELVLVVPRSAVLPGEDPWRGIRAEALASVLDLITREGTFQPRGPMEGDSSFKQIIPYVVLRNGADYFLMRRTRAGTDRRLHDRWSIGIGGHVNAEDRDVRAGLEREWSEELDAAFVPETRFVGLLNDDTTDVGRVHLGLVFVADAGGRSVAVRETAKLEGHFAGPTDVAAVADNLESWSRLVFDQFEDGPAGGGWDTGAEAAG